MNMTMEPALWSCTVGDAFLSKMHHGFVPLVLGFHGRLCYKDHAVAHLRERALEACWETAIPDTP